MKRKNGYCAVLTMALVIAAQPAAWSQRCQVVAGGVKFGACATEGAACGAPAAGMCITMARQDSVFHCNCVDTAGGIIPAGEPGSVWWAAIAGPFDANSGVQIKELNTGTKPVTNLNSFIVHQDGTNQFLTIPTLQPGKTEVQSFELPANGPVLVGVTGPNLKGVRFDAVSLAPDGSTFNVPHRDWTEKSKTPYYFQHLVDLSSFPITPVLGPWAVSSSTQTFQFFEYNNQFSDQAYTVNVVDDSGTTTSSTPFTVPLGQIGTVALPTLPDFNVTISCNGIAGAQLSIQNLANPPASGSKVSH
jgi:hypothetical protein